MVHLFGRKYNLYPKRRSSLANKSRVDNVFDQYNREFMINIMWLCSFICGFNWYKDKINCYIPEKLNISKYVADTCWVQGIYIYRELLQRPDDIAYYGININIDLNGIHATKNVLCSTIDKLSSKVNEECIPMHKTLFFQYQYMPFVIAAFGLLYNLPYRIHKVANYDLIKLGQAIREDHKNKPDIKSIVETFFQKRHHKPKEFHFTVCHFLILVVKLGYLSINVVVFKCFDSIFNGVFASYGLKWWQWSKLNNSMKYDYTEPREFPMPANELLPPFGYCELTSGANKYILVCELSQHILYQYVMMILWFLLVMGIVVSVISFIVAAVKMSIGALRLRKLGEAKVTQRYFLRLTYREMDYMEFLKQQNILVYEEVKKELFKDKFGKKEHVNSTENLGSEKKIKSL